MTELNKPKKEPMTFTRNQAKLLGVISWMPCCWTVLFMILMVTAGKWELGQKIMAGSFVITFIGVNIITLALIVYYIVLISREADLTSNQKYSWGWMIFLFHAMAFPFVWHKFVWSRVNQPHRTVEAARPETAASSSRRRVVWLGLLSWAPLLWIILLIATVVVIGTTGGSPREVLPFLMATVVGLNVLTISLVVYSCTLINKADLTSEKKHNWYWTIFLLNIFVFPVVWYKFARKQAGQPGKPPSVVE